MSVTWDDTISAGGDIEASWANEIISAIKRRGAKYVVADDAYGDYQCDGADDDVQIQAALDALTSGRTWKEKVLLRGSFTIGARIDVPSYTIVDSTEALLTLANGVNNHMFFMSSAHHVDFMGGIIEGNKANQSEGSGIAFYNSYKGLVENMTINNVKDDAVLIWTNAYDVNVINNYLIASGASGIYEYLSSSRCTFRDNWVSGCGENGIAISTDCYLDIIDGNVCHANTWAGIVLHDNILGETIVNNTVRENTEEGIVLEIGCHRNMIMHNFVEENDYGDTNTFGGIELGGNQDSSYGDCDDNSIINNTSRASANKQAYGVIVRYSNCADNRIIGNNLKTNKVANLSDAGTTTIIKDNAGYVTKNNGTSTGTGAEQTLAHGCDFTPTEDEVFLSERSTGGALAYQSSAPNDTNIYITATNAKDYNWKVEKA